jgi:uncharacterized membrane protein YqjE
MSTQPDSEARSQSSASIGELFVDVSKDVSLLIRQEVELAKAELRESATNAGKGAGMLGGAGVIAHLGVIFVSVAIWWGIGNATGRGWAGLIVGAVYLAVAAVLAALGRKNLKEVKGLPRTATTVQKIPAAMKGNEDVR